MSRGRDRKPARSDQRICTPDETNILIGSRLRRPSERALAYEEQSRRQPTQILIRRRNDVTNESNADQPSVGQRRIRRMNYR
jgi:hypothetical protein